MDTIVTQAKNVGDVIAVTSIIATLMELLPALSALAGLVWMCIRIYETDTVQKLVRKKDK